MHLVSAFQHSIYLELAIIDLEQMGISKKQILALPLDKNNSSPSSVQAAHQDAKSYVDLLFICGTVGMLLGAIYGFVLAWGPVIWGLLGMVLGALVGLLIEWMTSGKKMFQRGTTVDVILIVDCNGNQTEAVEQILWGHHALGVAKHAVLAAD